MTDTMWKVLTIVIGTVLVPTFGWVWTTHTQLNTLRTEYDMTRSSVERMSENSTDIRIIQNDIKHMDKKIDDLMVIVVKMSQQKKDQ